MSKINPAIPTSTLESMMGKKRWRRIIHEIFKYYKTGRIVLAFHKGGPRILLRDEYGECIGTVPKVERWANKRHKQRQEKILARRRKRK